jgi:hypothetical protein
LVLLLHRNKLQPLTAKLLLELLPPNQEEPNLVVLLQEE